MRLNTRIVAKRTGCTVTRTGDSKSGWIDIDAPDGMLSQDLQLPGNTYHYSSDDYEGEQMPHTYQQALEMALEDFAELEDQLNPDEGEHE